MPDNGSHVQGSDSDKKRQEDLPMSVPEASCSSIIFEYDMLHRSAVSNRPPDRREAANPGSDAGGASTVVVNARDPAPSEPLANFLWIRKGPVDPETNARRLIHETNTYLNFKVDIGSPNIREILAWLKRSRAMHMCSRKTFLSILSLGKIASSHSLKNMWLNKGAIIESTLKTLGFRRLGITDPEIIRLIEKHLKLYIKKKQTDMKPDLVQEAMIIDEENNRKRKFFQRESDIANIVQNTELVTKADTHMLVESGTSLDSVLNQGERDAIEKMTDEMLLKVKGVLFHLPGCQSIGDIKPRLDHTVCAVVGPHYHDYGRTEVVLVLKPEIMFHPDYYDTPISALMYSLGIDGDNNWGRNRPNVKHPLDRTPWHANEGGWERGGRERTSSKARCTAQPRVTTEHSLMSGSAA